MTRTVAVVILLMAFVERESIVVSKTLHIEEIPFTKSLAISMNFTKSDQTDVHLDRNFIEIYREMMKMNREVDDSLGLEEEKRLKRIVGEDNLMLIKGGALTRRRGLMLRQMAEQRRQQNKALRREKLKGQGLRNHMQHVKKLPDNKDDVDFILR